ncbi:MAG: CDP-glycerol glycerophosphotransferase family protein [Oscillospiraceae bacterium]|nr:CDP-glycerol glycerophosphotransferase family protein [Oscillospiraceae bacterium]
MSAGKPVLFAGTRPLQQTEQLKSVFDAWEGAKTFVQVDRWRHHPEIRSGKYELMVCDEYPTESPGKIVMLSHGFAGCKLGGLDQPYPYHSAKNAHLMDWVVAAGKGVVKLQAKACGVPESSVLPLGSPRTDAYIGKRKGDGGTEFAKKRVYFYLPTYRTREETPLPELDWGWLDSQLTDDELLAVRPHPMTEHVLRGSWRHIREYGNKDLFSPWLMDCDVVITDYSASMIDGFLLGKPCVLLEKVRGYTETRGMYLDYPGQYSDRYARDERELLRLCREAEGLSETELACRDLLAGACDGHAVERICGLIGELV